MIRPQIFSSTLAGTAALLIIARLLLAPGSALVEYRVDPAQSSFQVRTGSTGLLKTFGHDHTIAIPNFTGTLRLTPGTITPASLEMTVEAYSLVVVGDEKNGAKIERDMRVTVLETERFPQIVFQSTSMVVTTAAAEGLKVRITGDLTLHGVKRPIVFDAASTVSDERVRAQGRFTVKHKDYGMKQFAVAGGTVKVKDEIELRFDIVAVAVSSAR